MNSNHSALFQTGKSRGSQHLIFYADLKEVSPPGLESCLNNPTVSDILPTALDFPNVKPIYLIPNSCIPHQASTVAPLSLSIWDCFHKFLF